MKLFSLQEVELERILGKLCLIKTVVEPSHDFSLWVCVQKVLNHLRTWRRVPLLGGLTVGLTWNG